MKKVMSLLLVAIMVLSLAACGQKDNNEVNNSDKPYAGITLRFVAVNHSWTTAMEPIIAEFEE